MQKIERLMAIILALKKRKKMTAKELADTFEVNMRTIYRDIQALSEMNVPVVSYPGNDGGYEILDDYFIPPVMFNKEEVFALLLAKKIIDIIDIPGYSKYSNSAFLKIENLVCDNFKKDFDDIQKRIVFDIKLNDKEIDNPYIFDMVKKALKDNLKMKITYMENNSDNLSEHIIRPYGIVFEDGIWFIAAYSELNNHKTDFILQKIKEASVLDEVFDFPDNFSMTNYYSTTCFKNANNNDNSITVKLKVKKNLYSEIKDQVFFKYGHVEEKDDCFIVNVKTPNPGFYISVAFRFFNCMEILEPAWLREKFKEELNNLNDIYKL